ncbi:MAG: tRNA (adenosine(37)-N6)-threonylcarbamoyltransferase complex dimerization subunit type 1 TsaB [Bacteroidia bacterium]|nr:tRNA (adenosine(37)-N6)-threonylcarbamoyltransferase complex dimerization subunit type 1 TsaB [Sphingobacteriaceae bacterium]MBP9068101.1 tRNA (adenosine(37)-N6)-threonylcarbamoyltransferase complex dimerization subunit type 1 TsaB [Bacteroidia bacterium]
MAVILHIETATSNCSVSLSDGERVLATIELNEGYTHAENLHPFIEQLFKKTNLKPEHLNAVALSAGPGSYTGIRIGTSAAKGFCYALNIPLIAINTLQVLSAGAVKLIAEKDVILCPMLDARRMEIYTAAYNDQLLETKKTEAKIVDENSVKEFRPDKITYYFGDGMPKCKTLLQTHSGAKFLDNIVPSSSNMLNLALTKYKAKQFEDIAYFEPLYLKEYFFKTKQ